MAKHYFKLYYISKFVTLVKIEKVKNQEKKNLPPSPDLSEMKSVRVDDRTVIYVKKDITEEELNERIFRYNERKKSISFGD
jgi:hypothetical protein